MIHSVTLALKDNELISISFLIGGSKLIVILKSLNIKAANKSAD